MAYERKRGFLNMKAIKKPTHRAHVHYSGRVQGVGFRYTAENVAHRLGLVGWIKNLTDGRVELVCEGPKAKIDQLLSEIQEGSLGGYIKKADCVWEEPTQEYEDFRVEFCY